MVLRSYSPTVLREELAHCIYTSYLLLQTINIYKVYLYAVILQVALLGYKLFRY